MRRLEKIKTIGDGYMAVCGLSVPRLDHDKRTVDFALEMLAFLRRFNYKKLHPLKGREFLGMVNGAWGRVSHAQCPMPSAPSGGAAIPLHPLKGREFPAAFNEKGLHLDLRLGINSGDVVAGVIGKNKLLYDVWGDTVNIANRLKSACPLGSNDCQ